MKCDCCHFEECVCEGCPGSERWKRWKESQGRRRVQPRPTPLRYWSYAALATLAGSIFTLVLFVAPAHALTGPELDALVPKIIAAESSGDPRAVGDGGKARGLMQVQRATWKAFSSYPWEDAFDPEKNVQVGRKILETINETYEARGVPATEQRIIYSYNTGRYAWGAIPSWTKKHPNDVYRAIFKAS